MNNKNKERLKSTAPNDLNAYILNASSAASAISQNFLAPENVHPQQPQIEHGTLPKRPRNKKTNQKTNKVLQFILNQADEINEAEVLRDPSDFRQPLSAIGSVPEHHQAYPTRRQLFSSHSPFPIQPQLRSPLPTYPTPSSPTTPSNYNSSQFQHIVPPPVSPIPNPNEFSSFSDAFPVLNYQYPSATLYPIQLQIQQQQQQQRQQQQQLQSQYLQQQRQYFSTPAAWNEELQRLQQEILDGDNELEDLRKQQADNSMHLSQLLLRKKLVSQSMVLGQQALLEQKEDLEEMQANIVHTESEMREFQAQLRLAREVHHAQIGNVQLMEVEVLLGREQEKLQAQQQPPKQQMETIQQTQIQTTPPQATAEAEQQENTVQPQASEIDQSTNVSACESSASPTKTSSTVPSSPTSTATLTSTATFFSSTSTSSTSNNSSSSTPTPASTPPSSHKWDVSQEKEEEEKVEDVEELAEEGELTVVTPSKKAKLSPFSPRVRNVSRYKSSPSYLTPGASISAHPSSSAFRSVAAPFSFSGSSSSDSPPPSHVYHNRYAGTPPSPPLS